MNKYERYKKVDLPWLEEVPEHWDYGSLKRISNYKTGNSIKDDEKRKYSSNENSRKFITTADINAINMSIVHRSNIFVPYNDTRFKVSAPGSTLVCIEGGSGGRKVAFSTEEVTFGNKLCSIKTYEQCDKFIYYVIRSESFKTFYSMFTNGDRNGVSLNNIGKYVFPIPSFDEQKKIVEYLDWKINEIDQLIALETEKIERLLEWEKVKIEEIIFNNSNDSSLSDWYDNIPRNSIEIKIKNIFKLRDERNHLTENEVELLSLYSKIGIIRNKDVKKTAGNKNTTVENYKNVCEQDIVVNIMLCWMGAIGVSRYNGVTSPAYDVYKPDLTKVVPEYYHYLFRTNKFKSELYKNGKGIVLMKWRVYSEKFCNIVVPLPEIEEQRRVLNLIKKIGIAVEDCNETIYQVISNLESLKTSLISEVVTGKIDVRNVVIPSYEKVDINVSTDEEEIKE